MSLQEFLYPISVGGKRLDSSLDVLPSTLVFHFRRLYLHRVLELFRSRGVGYKGFLAGACAGSLCDSLIVEFLSAVGLAAKPAKAMFLEEFGDRICGDGCGYGAVGWYSGSNG